LFSSSFPLYLSTHRNMLVNLSAKSSQLTSWKIYKSFLQRNPSFRSFTTQFHVLTSAMCHVIINFNRGRRKLDGYDNLYCDVFILPVLYGVYLGTRQKPRFLFSNKRNDDNKYGKKRNVIELPYDARNTCLPMKIPYPFPLNFYSSL